MKDTGYVRRLDRLGRIVIPKKILKNMNIGKDTPLEIYAEGGDIKIRPYVRDCVLCGKPAGTYEYMGRSICEKCRMALSEMLKRSKRKI